MKLIYQKNTQLKAYAGYAYDRPDLDDPDTRRLVRQAQEGDENARNRIVEAYMKYVFNILGWKYCLDKCSSYEIEDLVQEGMMGLTEAIYHYRVEQETRFATCAAFWICKKISLHLQEQASLIHKPAKYVRKVAVQANKELEFMQLYGHKPDLETLADLTGESLEKTRRIRDDRNTCICSLEGATSSSDDVNGEISILDILSDPSDVPIEEKVCQSYADQELVCRILETLQDETDKKIVLYILMSPKEKVTHREIAEFLGCSRQNVSKRVKGIRAKLRTAGLLGKS